MVGLLILICLVPFAGYVVLQFPQIQTSLAKRMVRSLEGKTNGDIAIDRISIVFFNKVMAYNVCITGDQGDTLGSFAKISVTASPGELLKGRILVNRILLEDGSFYFRKEDSPFKHNIGRIFNIIPRKDTTTKKLRLPPVTIESLNLNNITFGMENSLIPDRKEIPPQCIDFADLRISSINARIHQIHFEKGCLTATIRNLQCTEKCGYGLMHLSGNLKMDSTEARIDNLRLTDSYSDLTARYLSFGYSSGKDWNSFVNNIRMGADFINSDVDFRSIGIFAPSLSGNGLRLRVNGEITGPVRYLVANNLHVTSGNSTDLHTAVSIKGLPDISQTIFAVKINRLQTEFREISDIIGYFSSNGHGPQGLYGLPQDLISFQGNAFGRLSNIQLKGDFSSTLGSMGIEAGFSNPPDGKTFDIKTGISLENVSAGRILHNPHLGEVSLKTEAKASISKTSPLLDSYLYISSMHIGSLWFKGHNYKGIDMMGVMENGIGDLRMISHDRSLRTILQAIVSFREGNALDRFRLFMDVPYANLSEMKLAKNEKHSLLSFRAKADLRFVEGQSILGSLIMDNINYNDNNGFYKVDSLEILSLLREKSHIISIESPIFSANYIASDSPGRLMGRLTESVLNPCFPEVFMLKDTLSGSSSNIPGDYSLEFTAHDLSPLCNIFVPGLSIANGTALEITLDKNNVFDLKFNSELVSFNDNRVRHPVLNISNRDGRVSTSISSDLSYISGSILSGSRITAIGNGEGMDFGISFNNADTTSLSLTGDVSLKRNERKEIRANIHLDESRLKIRRFQWDIAESYFEIAKRFYRIEGFGLHNDKESFSAEGTVSENNEDLLSVNLKDFDISLLNSFIKSNLGLSGRFSGEMVFQNFYSGMGAAITISGSDVALKQNRIDSIIIMSRWDQSKKRFNLLLNNYNEGRNPINATGYFIPDRKFLNLTTHLKRLEMKVVSTITDSFMDIVSGTASGDILISGTTGNLSITSNNFTLDSVKVIPLYTQVPYLLNGKVDLTDRAITLKDFTATDPAGSKARLSGSISHSSLKNMYLDANLNFSNLLVLNTPELHNSSFYGTAYASGLISVTGSPNDLFIAAQISTNDNTDVHIPMSSGSSATTTDLISYVQPESDSTVSIAEFIHQKETRKSTSNLRINATAAITPGAEVLIEMSKQYGEALRCTGSGNLELDFNPSRKIMNLRGDYTIADGSYHLSLAGIQSRDFIINEGGTITFNGDIRNTSLNVGATYRTKASISTLIADTTSVGNRRNIDCGINLSGSLMNPQIDFSIDIPDLDPITKGMVESALSTPDKVQKQLMSLLISGSFVPDQQSGIINNSTLLYSNASEILANQFNNIFRQLDIPLDLGLNYQPGTSGEKDIFDVAISYQAFNNRLVINGNVGTRKTSSNWAGDFEAELKVDKRGKLRITVFTRSSDSYSNYLDNTQRNGFGVTFQDEFDTFGDFWRNLFYTKKRKEEYELEQLRKAEEDLKREAEEANIKKEIILKPKDNPMDMTISNQTVIYQSDTTSVNRR